MASLDEADRRNGSLRRHLPTEFGPSSWQRGGPGGSHLLVERAAPGYAPAVDLRADDIAQFRQPPMRRDGALSIPHAKFRGAACRSASAIAARYDKPARNSLAAVDLAAVNLDADAIGSIDDTP
jgi:hypothetical protein